MLRLAFGLDPNYSVIVIYFLGISKKAFKQLPELNIRVCLLSWQLTAHETFVLSLSASEKAMCPFPFLSHFYM